MKYDDEAKASAIGFLIQVVLLGVFVALPAPTVKGLAIAFLALSALVSLFRD